jgi:RNA polymerase sigma-70 factor (ECF subfamily)
MTSQSAADEQFKQELALLIPHMRAFARSLCRDATQADDLAQEALHKAWKNRASYQAGTNMKAWTFMIVRNQFLSEKRRSWRSTQLDPAVAEQTLVAVSNPPAALELDEVRRALHRLPDEQREALILIGVAGMSYEEVSMICGCAEGTIKSRVSRARQRLTHILASGDFGQDDGAPGNAMADVLSQAEAIRARKAA